MRKLLGGAGGGSTGAGPGAGRDYQPEQELLGLNHLRKLYSEYSSPGQQLSTGDRETRLYAMLPLFCKIFNSVPPSVITERFAEATSFCQACSRLLVTEVRRRASNQSTEQAAGTIARFLEVAACEADSAGWLLISTVNLLAAEGGPLVEVMTAASVPSTLVKCLYLFFDLSDCGGEVMAESVENSPDSPSEFTPRERRILLQKMFMQVLLRLCSHVPAVEELARKDDLTLLFSAVSSTCPPHNLLWRKTSSDVLLTISRHSLSQPVISYLHNKGCITLCIENMQRGAGQDISPLEVVEMFVSIFCFLKDSSTVSQTLLDDFRSCQGYIFLSEFLLKLETDTDPESSEATRNLVLLVASLSFCGHAELPPAPDTTASSLYQLEHWQMPSPENRGSTVRNLQAFQVLQSVFMKSQTVCLGGTILDAISTIYHGDNANYFLLQSQHTLSQAAERIASKPRQVQEKFFQLIEFLVQHLQYIPTKELIAISLVLRSKKNLECCVLAVQSLIQILKSDPIFREVFREVGMVEVLVCLLSLYTEYQGGSGDEGDLFKPSMGPLGEAVVIALAELLSSCPANAGVFRELGGPGLAGRLVEQAGTREQGLTLLRQLCVAAGPAGEEDMRGLLELLHSAGGGDGDKAALRSAVLQCVVATLRESHRCRTVFRRVGGFVYVMSVLVGLEGALDGSNAPPPRPALALLHHTIATLAAAMRYEPANAKFFAEEVAGSGLAEAVRLLGCFSSHNTLQPTFPTPDPAFGESYQTVFAADPQGERVCPTLPPPPRLEACCLVLRLLHDLALDQFRPRSRQQGGVAPIPRPQPSQDSPSTPSTPPTPGSKKKLTPLALNSGPRAGEPMLVHSGVVLTVMQLLPAMWDQHHPAASAALQLFAAETVRSLVRAERNQQVLCDAGMMSSLLSVCRPALLEPDHPLHCSTQYLLERLAAQKLQPADLRHFLRLGSPLACSDTQQQEAPPANQQHGGGFVPLTRVKTLVSMTTPKDLHIQNNSILPPFVEFDMSSEGFGCLYLPSLAPQSASPASSGVVAGLQGSAGQAGEQNQVSGGVGLGDRSFPPVTGLSFSTWICVERFSCPRSDPHPVRLLSLGRGSTVCLSLTISSRDKAVVVSCQESAADTSSDWQPEYSGEWGARVWFPDILKEGEWHHLVFTLAKQQRQLTLYIGGVQVAATKLHYIPAAGAAGQGPVFGWIGSPPAWRRPSRLCWRQGPATLLEDVVSPALAALLHRLGPHYLGSLQAPQLAREVLGQQVAEDRILVGLNAVAVTEMTLAKIRKVYSKVDTKAIARQLGMGTHENATPIRVVHNSAGHLLGPARCLGGVVIGYLGVRVFTPQPVSKVIQTVGGCNVLLGLIAMARDVESLYAGVKALVCVLKSNPFSRSEMEQISGYQVLAMLLRKKSGFLNSHILHLIFTLVGTVDSRKEVGGIPNLPAFRDLLCDLQLWHQVSY